MDDNSTAGEKRTRREVIKATLAAGAYAAPLILSATVPATLSAQHTGGTGTGTLTGIVSRSSDGSPIAGATVTIGSRQVTTDATGTYTMTNAPTGAQTVITSAAGFATRTDTVTVGATGTTTFSPALVSGSVTGITIVLTWGATPSDLDSHLTGPNGASRFETYYGNTAPVAYATLDRDDTDSFGPETITVSAVGGNFVPGDYHYFVHNYSQSPSFNNSTPNPIVTVFQSGAQIAQFSAGAAAGNSASVYWQVFNFTLTATPTGQITINPLQQFLAASPGSVDRSRYQSKGGIRRTE